MGIIDVLQSFNTRKNKENERKKKDPKMVSYYWDLKLTEFVSFCKTYANLARVTVSFGIARGGTIREQFIDYFCVENSL